MDLVTVGLILTLFGLFLTVIWLVLGQRQHRQLLAQLGRLVSTLVKGGQADTGMKEKELLQRQKEHEWQKFLDLADRARWVMEFLESSEDEDE